MSELESVPRRAVLLVNVKSRRGGDWFAPVRDRLASSGIELVEATAFRYARDLTRSASQHVAAGMPLVIVGGGDGTLSSVAHLFARKQPVLGVLPLGTGNAFARDLGIPVDVDAACDVIVGGKVAHVDMGIVGNREFLNVATVGLTTNIALGLTNEAKKKLGRAVYIASLAKALVNVHPFRVQLDLAEGMQEFDSLQVVIGNGRFHAGPFQVAPDASITGGYLSIYALASPRKSDFLKMALYVLGGGYVNLPGMRSYRVKSGRLTTIGPQRVTVDGEVCLTTPVEFGIAARALRVAVPADFDERR